MATPVAAPRRSPPTLMTPSTFTRDISRAIMASSQVPKSIDLELNPQANLEFPPPPPPPSPVESQGATSFWGPTIDAKRA